MKSVDKKFYVMVKGNEIAQVMMLYGLEIGNKAGSLLEYLM